MDNVEDQNPPTPYNEVYIHFIHTTYILHTGIYSKCRCVMREREVCLVTFLFVTMLGDIAQGMAEG